MKTRLFHHRLRRLSKKVLAFFVIVLPAGSMTSARAQSAFDGFDPDANGAVLAIAVHGDGKIVIGGTFTQVQGVTRNRIARLHPNGILDVSFDPNADNDVLSIAVQPDGRILLGGVFTSLAPNGGAAVTRNYIARLEPTGLFDAGFNPSSNSYVRAIALQPDGKIVVGGDFSALAPNGGPAVARNCIARLEPSGLVDASFDPNADDQVHAIALQADGKILLGGIFTTLTPNGGANVTRAHIARLQRSGLLDTAFDPNANDNIYAIAVQADGRILIGGTFFILAPNGGAAVARNRMARLQSSGVLDSGFDPNVNSDVYSIVMQGDGKILVGGQFTALAPNGGASVARNRIARLEPTGLLDSVFDPNAGGEVRTIVVQSDGKVLAGGNFTTIRGQPRNRIARLERDGRVDQTLNNPNVVGGLNTVNAIAVQSDGKILIGGDFTNVLGVARNRIARLNTDGTLDTAFDPNASGEVLTIAVQTDGKILAGGRFTSVGGQTRNFIARLDATTGLADSFDPNATGGAVHSIAMQTDGKILVGGNFTSIGGELRNFIARIEATTGSADSFNPNPNGGISSIAVQADGKILAGGGFNGANSIGGQTRNRIARLDPTTGLADSFNPNADNLVWSIRVQADGKVLAGGFFRNIGGQTRNSMARLDSTIGLADSFNPNADNAVLSIAVQADGKVLAGGRFNNIGGQTRNAFARLDATTGLADSFDPNPDWTVASVGVQADGKVLLGGLFSSIGGQPRNLFARLTNDTAAQQNLAVSQTTVTWMLGGSSPQFSRVTFEQSIDNVTYNFLGNGTALGSNWSLTGLNLPTGQNLYIRARGYYRAGFLNASESIIESVRNTIVLPLRIITITRTSNDMAITYEATAGNTYRLERKAGLTETNWQAITGVFDEKPEISGAATFSESRRDWLGSGILSRASAPLGALGK